MDNEMVMTQPDNSDDAERADLMFWLADLPIEHLRLLVAALVENRVPGISHSRWG